MDSGSFIQPEVVNSPYQRAEHVAKEEDSTLSNCSVERLSAEALFDSSDYRIINEEMVSFRALNGVITSDKVIKRTKIQTVSYSFWSRSLS